MMTKMKLALAAGLLAAVTLVGNTAMAQSSKEPLKIGGVLDLTGPLSWLGKYYEMSSKLRVEEINAAGGIDGRRIELVIYDAQSTPEEAVRVTERLISRDNVSALFGTATTANTAAVASFAARARVPFIHLSGYAIDPAKDTFVFSTTHPTTLVVSRAFENLKKHNLTKVALLMPIGPLGELGSRVANQTIAAHGLTIVGEEKFDVRAVNVTSQLAKIRELKPDVIFSFVTGEPAALVARNMAEIDFKVPLLVSQGNAGPLFLKMVTTLPIQILVPAGRLMVPETIPANDPARPLIAAFAAKHEVKYQESINYFSGLAYDAISLIADASRRSNSIDPKVLRDTIEQTKGFVGVGGEYNLSPTDHYGMKPDTLTLLTIKNGKFQQF
jgi:branched-chain amino acid transport system substrate-binding protein